MGNLVLNKINKIYPNDVQIDKDISICFNNEKVYFFDAETELRIK